MAVLRNALTTIAVTALLIGSLIFLFPTAQAATVGNLSVTSNTASDITVQAVIDIPNGEHIPISHALLYGVVAPHPVAGNVVGSDTLSCSGTTSILTIAGMTLANSAYTGYGYEVADIENKGYGYGYSYGYSFNYDNSATGSFTGTGYGYGYGSTGGQVTVTAKATGCSIAFSGGLATYDIQLLVGGPSQKIASLPATVTLADPGFSDPGNPQVVAGSDGLTLIGDALNAGSGAKTVPITGISGVDEITIEATGATVLPKGSKVIVAPASATDAAFGVAANAKTDNGRPAAIHLQIKVIDGTTGNALSSGVTLTVKFTIPETYFTSNPTLSKNDVLVKTFDDAGNPKGTTLTASYLSCDSPCTQNKFSLTITSFSSYVAYGNPAGGGGGGSPTTPPATPPTDSDNDGLPDSWEIANFGDITTTTGGADDDGDGLSNAQEYAAGTNPLSRDSDGDGINDGDEVAQGTDPTDPKDPLPPGSTDPGTTPSEPSAPATPGKKDGSRTPGFELVALVGALGAALVFARRRS